MAWVDAVWPWSAIREARGYAERQWDRIAALNAGNEALRERLSQSQVSLTKARIAIRKARYPVCSVHFRGPETNRLGERGIVPKGLLQ